MNSFVENVNYVAGLDNLYGSGIELYKNNLSLKSVQHDIELKFSYYNNDDKKIHSIVHLEPGVLVGGIDDTLLSFKTLVESSITGSEFTCTVSSGVQNFVINNIVMVNIAIDSNNNTYKAYELEMKVITAGAATYDVFGEVKDSLKILPSLAMITSSEVDVMANVYEIKEEIVTVSESIADVETVSDSIANVNTVATNITNVNIVGEDIANVNTVASNIVGLNSIVSNMPEILLADDNAAIATTKALESSDSAAASLQSSLDSAASSALFPNHIADITNPHEVTKIQVGLEFAENTADIDKIVASAGKLTTAVNISLSGDASGSVSFDGSCDADIVVSIDDDSHIHSDATTSVSGFMSTSDKIKLDAIAPGSNNYVHPSTHDASIITTTYEFSNSDSTNVQDVLDDLDYAIDVEKGRIDAILIGAGANADTFAEVVTLVNSIDTTNDQAFAGYVLSNDARSATIEGDISALESNKADKATTLSGYGITDADTSAQVTTKVNNAVGTAVSGLVNSAPGLLDTLDELANALGDDPNFATTVTNSIAGKASTTYVDNGLALKTNKSDTDSVNLLRADKYLAAQNIAQMLYDIDGNLSKIQYNNAIDADYEILNYTSGNLSSINHYVASILSGTTILSYTDGNLVSAIFTEA